MELRRAHIKRLEAETSHLRAQADAVTIRAQTEHLRAQAQADDAAAARAQAETPLPAPVPTGWLDRLIASGSWGGPIVQVCLQAAINGGLFTAFIGLVHLLF